jgi:hypothetical protein
MPPELLVIGVPLVVLVPAIVQGAKNLGLPTRYAGVAAMAACAIVLGLLELQKEPSWTRGATWALLSIVYGLAAAGLYSQAKELTKEP